MNLKNYETVFILTPVLSEAQMKDTSEKFKKVLTDHGAEIINIENWGLKKLAYPIQQKSTGFFNFIEFTSDPGVVESLELEFRRDEQVMRFLTTVLDKHAWDTTSRGEVAHSIRKRKNLKKKK